MVGRAGGERERKLKVEKILWNDCLNSQMEKTLDGILQSGFIGLGVDPICIEMISLVKHGQNVDTFR